MGIIYSKTYKQPRTEEENEELSKILQREFRRVELATRKAQLEELKDHYRATFTDTFSKGNVIRYLDDCFEKIEDQMLEEFGP